MRGLGRMAKRHGRRQIVTAVEIGTRLIKVLIGEVAADGAVTLLGTGVEPSSRVVKGEVTDTQALQPRLDAALGAAERKAGVDIENIFLVVSGAHIQSFNTVGTTVPASPDRRIYELDIDAVRQIAATCTLPLERQQLHLFSRQFRVDGREVSNPLGLCGHHLVAEAHLIHGQVTRLQTVERLIGDAVGSDEEPREPVFAAVAAGMGALLPEEVDAGALVVDIGAGVTSYALFRGSDQCYHSGQITVGGEQLANDLALGLHLPIQRCRDLLDDLGQVGAAIMTPDGRTRLAPIEGAPGRRPRAVPVSTIEQIVEVRLRELLSHIRAELEQADMLRYIGHGVKLCGGGALIPRIEDLAHAVFEMPVEIGYPVRASGPQEIVTSPAFTTPIGALRFGQMRLKQVQPEARSLGETLRADLVRVKRFFRGFSALKW